jgi:hypothetical protein
MGILIDQEDVLRLDVTVDDVAIMLRIRQLSDESQLDMIYNVPDI